MKTPRSCRQGKAPNNEQDKKPPTISPVLFQSKRADWNTPRDVLDPIRAFAGPSGIGLDPCSNATSIVGARIELRQELGQDGLAVPWFGHGLVFVNPPYTRRDSPRWSKKVVSEAASNVEIILLIAARPDTRWFEPLWKAQAICFWKGRIKFLGAKYSAPFPSAVVYFGPQVDRFHEHFEPVGRVVLPGATPTDQRTSADARLMKGAMR